MKRFVMTMLLMFAAILSLVSISSCEDDETNPKVKYNTSENMMYKFIYVDYGELEHADNLGDENIFVNFSGRTYGGSLVFIEDTNEIKLYSVLSRPEAAQGEIIRSVEFIKYIPDNGCLNICSKEKTDQEYEVYYRDGIQVINTHPEYYLYRNDKNGNLLWGKKVKDIHESIQLSCKVLINPDGYIFFELTANDDDDIIAVASSDGELLFTLTRPEDCGYAVLGGTRSYQKCELVQNVDGNVYIKYSTGINSNFEITYISIDIENQSYGDKADFPQVEYVAEEVFDKTTGHTRIYLNTPIFGGGGYDIYYYNRSGLYGIKHDEEPTEIFRWLDVGISTDILEDIYILSEHEVFVKINESSQGGARNSYGRIAYVPMSSVYGEGVQEIPTLSIAIDKETNPYLSTMLSYAAAFVRSEGGCQVNIVSYSDAEGGMSANQKLAKDIANGKAPDVVMFGGGISYEILSKNGAFEDLYKFMDSGSLKRSDFLPCVLKPFERSNGELDRIVTEFSLCTLTADRDNVGDKQGWSFADYMALNDSLNGDVCMFGVSNMKSPEISMLEAILPYMIGEFVDYDSKTCDFTQFGELLELCKNTKYGENLYLDPSITADGRMILRQSEYADVDSFIADRYMYFDEGSSVQIGYPSRDGKSSGTFVKPITCMAIPKYSKNADGAWRFIEFVINQKEKIIDASGNNIIDTYSNISDFTCTYSGMQKWLERAKARYYIFNVNQIIGSDGLMAMNVQTKPIRENDAEPQGGRVLCITDDDCEALMSLFETAERVYTDDSIISGIIIDDASAYYDGIKPIDETIRLIESRVTTRIIE
ncbi:MAG: extracellular solute-binding protein [Clostridiales bacterium]|nr:extracellular solute-binding protein [Clostridiales bacterium]